MQRPVRARILPVDVASMGEHQRALAGIGASNVIGTLVRHAELLEAWLGLGQKLLFSTRLTPRERELVVLRVALRTSCEYEWANHVLAALAAGATPDELRALRDDSGTRPPAHAALLDAVDELCAHDSVSDATWAELTASGDEQRCIEVLFLIGYYRMNAGVLNALGVQPEAGRPRLGEIPVSAPAPAPSRAGSGSGATDGDVRGTWQVVFHHPAGDQQLTLELRLADNQLSGSVANAALGVSIPIAEGTVDDNRFVFSAPMSTPIQVDIGYAGAVDGDHIWGEVTVGGGGTFPFDGTRTG